MVVSNGSELYYNKLHKGVKTNLKNQPANVKILFDTKPFAACQFYSVYKSIKLLANKFFLFYFKLFIKFLKLLKTKANSPIIISLMVTCTLSLFKLNISFCFC